MVTTRALLPTVAAAVLIALFCGLGFWQLERAATKEERRAAFEEARGVWRNGETQGRDPQEFDVVDLSGRYDPVHQFLKDNRTHRGRAGYHVLTPFHTARHGTVLVNRGWVPAAGDRTVLPGVAVPGGEMRIQGTVRFPLEDLFVLGDTGYAANGWPRVIQRVEIDAMRQALGYPLAKWLVALDPGAPHGYVREWRPYPGLSPARHRGYAFQWFALATALLAIWLILHLKRGRQG